MTNTPFLALLSLLRSRSQVPVNDYCLGAPRLFGFAFRSSPSRHLFPSLCPSWSSSLSVLHRLHYDRARALAAMVQSKRPNLALLV